MEDFKNIYAMKKLLFIGFGLLIIAACDKDDNGAGNFEFVQQDTKTIILSGQTKLDIQNNNGNIHITGSDTATNIYINLVKKVKSTISQSDAESHMTDIIIQTGTNQDVANLVADHPTNNEVEYQVDMDILLPLVFDYEVELGNGNVEIISTSGHVVVIVGNGNTVADLVLTDPCFVNMETGNGNISVTLPDTTNAQLSATIGNGTITNNGLTLENQVVTTKTLQGKLGNGAGAIGILLGNGNIILTAK